MGTCGSCGGNRRIRDFSSPKPKIQAPKPTQTQKSFAAPTAAGSNIKSNPKPAGPGALGNCPKCGWVIKKVNYIDVRNGGERIQRQTCTNKKCPNHNKDL